MKRVTYGILLLMLLVPMALTSCSKSEEAQAVDDMIAAIGEVTKDSEDSILKAEEAYTQLEDTDKKALSNYGKLQQARTAYDTLCAQEVEELIEKIETVTIDSKKDIEAALNKYDSLTENQQKLVSNAERLNEIEDERRLNDTDALKPGVTKNVGGYWQFYGNYNEIKKVVGYVDEVEFYDGTTWENPNNGSLYARYNERLLADGDEYILSRG